jgi:predicted PurR-regulated permease PerM
VRTPAAARWTTLVLAVIALLLLALIIGPVGLLAGPLIVSFSLAVIRMWDRSEAETA